MELRFPLTQQPERVVLVKKLSLYNAVTFGQQVCEDDLLIKINLTRLQSYQGEKDVPHEKLQMINHLQFLL